MMRRDLGRRARLASLAAAATLLWASAAFADDAADAPAASNNPAGVLTPQRVDIRAVQRHLAQTLGPDSARESHRYRPTVFGTPVQIGVSAGRAAAGPSFARPGSYDSATFERGATTGELGLLNVAWQGVQHLATR